MSSNDSNPSTPGSSAGSTPHRASRKKNYKEPSDTGSDDEVIVSDEDEEMLDPELEGEGDEGDSDEEVFGKALLSSANGLGSRGASKNKRLLNNQDRRRKNRSSDSDEIEVDDTVAILGSSAGGNGGTAGQRKKAKSLKTGPKESAAESQRKRLFMTLDKNKKKQSSGGTVGGTAIRATGGTGTSSASILGSTAASAGETRQKMPGIARYNQNINTQAQALDAAHPYSNNHLSPQLGSMERFNGNSHHGNTRGTFDGSGKNPKGLSFDLDPDVDVVALKRSSLSVSAGPSPVAPSFPNAGNAMQHQQQNMAVKSHGLGHGALGIASSLSANLLQANPHTVGPPGQDLQYKFDVLQHTHAQEKIRNLNLRQNLRDLFGFLQVPAPLTGSEEGQMEWSADKLDEYVQALRDAVVGTEEGGARPGLDVKKRDAILEGLLKEMAA